MKQLIKLTFALIVAAACLTGCSKKSELFENVPANSKMVARIDFTVLDKDLPAGPGVDRGFLDNLMEFGDAIDLKNVLWVVTPGSKSGGTFMARINSPEALEKFWSEKPAEKISRNGFTLYTLYSTTYAVNDGVLYFGHMGLGIETDVLNKMIKSAGKKSLAELPGVVDALTAETPYNLAIPMVDNKWGVMNGKIKGPAFDGEAFCITPEGKPVKYDGLTKVSTPLLKYAPTNSMLVFATGTNEKMDWDDVFENLGQLPASDPMTLAQLQMLEPYLKAIDGSMMLCMAPNGDELTQPIGIDSFKILFMIHMKQEMVNQAVESLKEMFGTVGVAEAGEGLYAVNINGTYLHFGNIDGYFTVANYKPDNNNSSALAGEFADTYGGMSVEIPSMTFLSPNATWGIDMRVKGDREKGRIVFQLTNTDKPLLPTLLSL